MSRLVLGEHVPDEIARFAREVGPEPNDVLSEMETVAKREGFPIVGPAVGGWLCQLARLTGARRVLELGSGFGYSACWFARALPDDGEIVLTEFDPDLLERAEEFLEHLGAADLATFAVGDAVETASRLDGPFDVVLLDVEKHQYVDAFDAVREVIPPGGVIVADNTMTGGLERPDDVVNFEVLLAALEDPSYDVRDAPLDDQARTGTAGVFAYLDRVRADPAFESTLLPLGDGVTVTTRVR